MVQDLKGQLKFLQETKILPTSQTCQDCNNVITKHSNRGYFVFYQCGKCKKRISVRRGTVLANAKISFRRFILLAYAFCQFNWTYQQTQQEACVTSDEEDCDKSCSTHLSSKSIDKYHRLFREIVSDYMFESLKSVNKIGGPGLTVEIDESQFGKRKYNRGTIIGRRFAWILGGICRETEEMFLIQCPGNKRDKITLETLILDHVEQGTRIYTDGWASYKGLEGLGYEWDHVNHSEEFVKTDNPDVHTQTIEGRWYCVKRWLPSSGRYDLNMYLPVYMWTVDCRKRKKSKFWELLELISNCGGEKMTSLKTAKDKTSAEKEKPDDVKFPCLYCGKEIKRIRLARHLKNCKEK